MIALGYNEKTMHSVRGYPGDWSSVDVHARALERIAELEAGIRRYESTLIQCQNQRDEALAKLAQYEPPVDADLALARKIAGALYRKWGGLSQAQEIEAGEDDDNGHVQCALAGIKAGRAGGGL